MFVVLTAHSAGEKPRSQGAPHLTAYEEKAVSEFVKLCHSRNISVTPEYILKC